jgi:hypothetical protein
MTDLSSPVELSTFLIALTQIFKDLGLQGNWLKLVCVLSGGAAFYLMTYQPALWQALTGLILGTTATGGVSFVHGLLQKMQAPAGE